MDGNSIVSLGSWPYVFYHSDTQNPVGWTGLSAQTSVQMLLEFQVDSVIGTVINSNSMLIDNYVLRLFHLVCMNLLHSHKDTIRQLTHLSPHVTEQ